MQVTGEAREMMTETVSPCPPPSIKTYIFTCPKPNLAGSKWVKKLMEHMPSLIPTTRVEDCDIILCQDITTNDAALNTRILAKLIERSNGKPIAVFFHDDPDTTMDIKEEMLIDRVLVFRTSLLRSQKRQHERVWPSFQAADDKLSPLEPVGCDDPNKPKVGFCGVIRWPSRKAACVKLLQNKAQFTTMFRFRSDHHTQVCRNLDRLKQKIEFIETMRQCPYHICCRGAGNFSHRFYETLAYGRIPVLIDTDMCIPKHVPRSLWERCIVMAPNADVLVETFMTFHRKYDVFTTQILCRGLWEQFFTFRGYAPYVETQIRTLLPLVSEEAS